MARGESETNAQEATVSPDIRRRARSAARRSSVLDPRSAPSVLLPPDPDLVELCEGLLSVEIRGLRHYSDSPDELARLLELHPLRLVRDPGNEHDPLAIAAQAGLRRVGYLDKEIARMIAPFMDSGHVIAALSPALSPPSAGYPLGRLWIGLSALHFRAS